MDCFGRKLDRKIAVSAYFLQIDTLTTFIYRFLHIKYYAIVVLLIDMGQNFCKNLIEALDY